ncbi:MAG: zf-TFIIB domain-containing protein [Methanomassiliicoccales archaeon]|nr:MAG: zf-TFIIB domain-containing protein [Methanomassiliicoccales archaeon]
MPMKKKLMDRKIDCPRCWVKMKQQEVEIFGPNITIDVCPKCQGTWLDYGELGKLLKDKKLTNYLTKEIGTQSKSELVCPRCGGLMDIERAEEIEVDVCLSCNGVWLDSGELDDLKSKSEEGFEGDFMEKAEEKWEERQKRNRESVLDRFLRKLTR